MNSEEVSAFAAYSVNKLKKKHGHLGLKVKSKHKIKKKKKSQDSSIDSAMVSLLKVTESDTVDKGDEKIKKKKKLHPDSVNQAVFAKESNNVEDASDKIKKKRSEKRKLIKNLLKAKRESIFKDCNLTSKVDNVFLDENNGHKESQNGTLFMGDLKDNFQLKKSKKRKLADDEQSDVYENDKVIETFQKDKGSGFEMENVTRNEMTDSEPAQSNKKNKLKGSSWKNNSPAIIYSDSVKVGEKVFSWLLSPLDMKSFFDQFWEQKPLHIKHNDDYFKSICTMEDFKMALLENEMYFSKNIDVTSYVNGRRTTENPEGMAKPSRVWSLYREGKSIRLLNPQTFISNVRLLNSALQEFFQCFVGANIYLTPPGTQGFAPHYDDIDAFVLQLEGEKHWKLYNSRSPEEVLPRESSVNFSEGEIGEPILEVTLHPGDLLYFPRGVIHQAKCLPHTHSLHITVSCCQKVTWADLLEKVLPVALQKAISENAEFRKSLPIGYLNHMGMVHYDRDTPQRREVIRKFEELARTVLEHCPLDAGVDQLGASFVHDALPPCLSEEEKLYGADRNVQDTGRSFLEALETYPDKNLSVKLIRATCVRLVAEEDETVLYYTTDNTLVYRENEAFSASVRTQWAQGVEYLIHSYPRFVEMKELPVSHKVNKPGKWKHIAEFVYFLWEKGLLLFDRPLKQIYR